MKYIIIGTVYMVLLLIWALNKEKENPLKELLQTVTGFIIFMLTVGSIVGFLVFVGKLLFSVFFSGF